MYGTRYQLLAADLRLPPTEALKKLTIKAELPTLLLFECVLVYMERTASDALLRWFVEQSRGPVGAVVYEMFGLEDAFGRMMVNNLKVCIGLGSDSI